MTSTLTRILLTLLVATTWTIAEQPVTYPDWVPMLNVKKFGAEGDGRSDDTEAIQRAIQSGNGDRELYFPPGVYLVSKPLVGMGAHGKSLGYLQFYGSGKGHTTIRLKDRCAGYQDEKDPNPVIHFRGMITKESGKAREQPNVAFFNSVYDLTVDVGTGNRGAVGIDWITCNGGSLRRVNVVSSDPQRLGYAGVRMNANDGTSYMCDVGIVGFDYGWWRGANAQCLAVEGLRLKDQRKAGIYNKNSVFSLHDLRSENRVPTLIQVDGIAQASILNARISGGASPVIHQQNPAAMLYLRDVRTDSTGEWVRGSTSGPPGSEVTGEWFSHPAVSAGSQKSIGLPVKRSQDFHDNEVGTWALVSSFSDDGTGDYSVRLQKAIDSGAGTIVMDAEGTRHYRSPVTVRASVKRIVGFWQSSLPAKDASFVISKKGLLSIDSGGDWADKPGQWFMRVEGTSDAPLIIEQFHHFPGGILNDSTRPLVLRDMVLPAYANTPAATGDLFVEGVCGSNYRISHGQNAWFRSVDAVFGGSPDILVDAATAWILSNRSEGGGVFVKAVNGAKVEIIGTSQFIGSHAIGDNLAFSSRDSDLTLINYSETGFGKEVYENIVSDIRDGKESLIDRTTPGVTKRYGRRAVMFYRENPSN